MYNFRQLVILVASVFIALGLGIAVGFSANSDKLLVEQHKITIDKLEKDFNFLKADNRQKQSELADLQEKHNSDMMMLDEIFDVLFKDILDTKKIALIGFDKDALSDVEKHLQKAGALVSTLSIGEMIYSGIGEGNASSGDPTTEETLVSLDKVVSAQVFHQIQTLEPNPELYIILRDNNSIDAYPLVTQFIETNKPVALVQPSGLSSIDLEQRKGFVYIDNIEDAIGKYNLMYFILSHTGMNLGEK